MAVGRPKKRDRPIAWKVYVPESVANPFELLTTDPVTGNPIKGARSEIISALVEAFMNVSAGADATTEMQRVRSVADRFIF